jgi:hypothetical protein
MDVIASSDDDLDDQDPAPRPSALATEANVALAAETHATLTMGLDASRDEGEHRQWATWLLQQPPSQCTDVSVAEDIDDPVDAAAAPQPASEAAVHMPLPHEDAEAPGGVAGAAAGAATEEDSETPAAVGIVGMRMGVGTSTALEEAASDMKPKTVDRGVKTLARFARHMSLAAEQYDNPDIRSLCQEVVDAGGIVQTLKTQWRVACDAIIFFINTVQKVRPAKTGPDAGMVEYRPKSLNTIVEELRRGILIEEKQEFLTAQRAEKDPQRAQLMVPDLHDIMDHRDFKFARITDTLNDQLNTLTLLYDGRDSGRAPAITTTHMAKAFTDLAKSYSSEEEIDIAGCISARFGFGTRGDGETTRIQVQHIVARPAQDGIPACYTLSPLATKSQKVSKSNVGQAIEPVVIHDAPSAGKGNLFVNIRKKLELMASKLPESERMTDDSGGLRPTPGHYFHARLAKGGSYGMRDGKIAAAGAYHQSRMIKSLFGDEFSGHSFRRGKVECVALRKGDDGSAYYNEKELLGAAGHRSIKGTMPYQRANMNNERFVGMSSFIANGCNPASNQQDTHQQCYQQPDNNRTAPQLDTLPSRVLRPPSHARTVATDVQPRDFVLLTDSEDDAAIEHERRDTTDPIPWRAGQLQGAPAGGAQPLTDAQRARMEASRLQALQRRREVERLRENERRDNAKKARFGQNSALLAPHSRPPQAHQSQQSPQTPPQAQWWPPQQNPRPARRSWCSPQQTPSRQSTGSDVSTPTPWNQNWVCYNCRAPGHLARDCPNKQTWSCFKCGNTGHYARNCPKDKDEG